MAQEVERQCEALSSNASTTCLSPLLSGNKVKVHLPWVWGQANLSTCLYPAPVSSPSLLHTHIFSAMGGCKKGMAPGQFSLAKAPLVLWECKGIPVWLSSGGALPFFPEHLQRNSDSPLILSLGSNYRHN
jgi:hypothetical protein